MNKFSYLKEFVIPKVRALVDGFPFTPGGYGRANVIFFSFFLQFILKYHAQILFILQVLDKINKLRDINVFARLTLDKLREFMGGFFRTG